MKHTFTLLALCAATALSAQTFTTWTTADGLPSNDLRDVAVDGAGNIWLASQFGVVRFDGSTFTVHNTTSHPGLASDGILAIAVAANGDVWAGTDFGVSVFDGSSYVTYTTVDGLGENQVTNIKQALNGDIWIGTINGVTMYRNSTFTAYTSPNIPFGGVTHIAFASNGDVWLSGGLGGVIIYDGSTFSTLTTADGLLSNRIRSIAFDGQDKWVATSKGISTFGSTDQHILDHTRPFILPPPDTLNPVTDIAIDSHGVVWAGVYVDYLVTEGGVCAYDGDSWVQYETSDGLAGPNVRRLAVDANDAVWVTSSSGLTRISGFQIGITEQVNGAGFALYPNPVADRLNVVFENGNGARTSVRVFDAGMRMVLSDNVLGDRTSLDVSALEAGVYMLQVGRGARRFVVTR